VNAYPSVDPQPREPVILPARDIRLPDLLRYIEAGHIVIIVPAPSALPR
jgi:hypothetical protein